MTNVIEEQLLKSLINNKTVHNISANVWIEFTAVNQKKLIEYFEDELKNSPGQIHKILMDLPNYERNVFEDYFKDIFSTRYFNTSSEERLQSPEQIKEYSDNIIKEYISFIV
jgi:hypothetical protein